MFDFTCKCPILAAIRLPGGASEFVVIFSKNRYARITALIYIC